MTQKVYLKTVLHSATACCNIVLEMHTAEPLLHDSNPSETEITLLG
jgi:hypothetical protein